METNFILVTLQKYEKLIKIIYSRVTIKQQIVCWRQDNRCKIIHNHNAVISWRVFSWVCGENMQWVQGKGANSQIVYNLRRILNRQWNWSRFNQWYRCRWKFALVQFDIRYFQRDQFNVKSSRRFGPKTNYRFSRSKQSLPMTLWPKDFGIQSLNQSDPIRSSLSVAIVCSRQYLPLLNSGLEYFQFFHKLKPLFELSIRLFRWIY